VEKGYLYLRRCGGILKGGGGIEVVSVPDDIPKG